MFKLVENDLIGRMRCKYEDELGNKINYIRKPSLNQSIIKIRNDNRNIRFDAIVLDTLNPGQGCTFNYHYDKDDENITKEYLDTTIKNFTEFMNYIIGLENAIRLLNVDANIMANYLNIDKEMKQTDRTEIASAAKLSLLTQYEELKNPFVEEILKK